MLHFIFSNFLYSIACDILHAICKSLNLYLKFSLISDSVNVTSDLIWYLFCIYYKDSHLTYLKAHHSLRLKTTAPKFGRCWIIQWHYQAEYYVLKGPSQNQTSKTFSPESQSTFHCAPLVIVNEMFLESAWRLMMFGLLHSHVTLTPLHQQQPTPSHTPVHVA